MEFDKDFQDEFSRDFNNEYIPEADDSTPENLEVNYLDIELALSRDTRDLNLPES